jgi:hypothetical protein
LVFNPWPSYFQLVQATLDANVVVAARLTRLASGGAVAQREAQRMVTEKYVAFAQAQMTAAAKMTAGVGIAGATKSVSGVYRRKVRFNRRRLVR